MLFKLPKVIRYVSSDPEILAQKRCCMRCILKVHEIFCAHKTKVKLTLFYHLMTSFVPGIQRHRGLGAYGSNRRYHEKYY